MTHEQKSLETYLIHTKKTFYVVAFKFYTV